VHFRRFVGINRANAVFLLAFFLSLAALIVSNANDRIVVLWLISFTAWAIALGWWMVAGALMGLFFHPVQLHVIDVAGTLLYVVAGAYIGFFVGFVWDMRPSKGGRNDR
jgi:hypothetical protein